MKKAKLKEKNQILEIKPFIKLRWAIVSGFFAVFMLILFLLGTSYRNLSSIETMVEGIIQKNSHKTAVIYLLYEITRERIIMLDEMIIEKDAEVLYEDLQEFTLLGDEFTSAMGKLKAISDSKNEIVLISDLQKNNFISTQLQTQIMEIFSLGDAKKTFDFLKKMDHNQIEVLKVMTSYSELQKSPKENLNQEIGTVFSNYFQWLLFMAGLILVISFLVVFFVMRFVSEQQKKLVGMNTTMESYNKILKLTMEASDRANRSKSEFIANMSHELRTPMTAIKGSLGILNSGVVEDIPKDAKELILMADNNTTKLVELVTDVLDFSKIESGKIDIIKEDISLITEIDKFLIPFRQKAKQKNIYINVKFSSKIPENILVDRIHLVQVLAQLVNNAIKFTVEGGVTLDVDCEDSQVVFRVIDTGIGFDEKDIHFLFESFVQGDGTSTRKFGGTGIGLAICKKLIEAMEGDIRVSSKLEKGSVFSLYVPFHVSTEAA